MILATGLLLVGIAWRDTMADPRILTAELQVPALPADSAPLRLLLMADIHVAGPDMPPSRLERIVRLANQQKPDIVLIAGDLVSDKAPSTRSYTLREAIAPLRQLKPNLAVVAVLGNHDHWRDAAVARSELASAGVIVLNNSAQSVGPLAIGGLDDDFTGRADVPATLTAMAQTKGMPILLSHSPDPFPDVPGHIPLMMAGHTHCGQLRYPWGGSPATMSRYGQRYACGRVYENGKVLIVSAGLGTSVLPFRFGAKPDMWLITLRSGQPK
jgi:uncharacterized protein